MNEKFLKLLTNSEQVKDLVSKGNNGQVIASFYQWYLGGPTPTYNSMCGLYLLFKEIDELFPEIEVFKDWDVLQKDWLEHKYKDVQYREKKEKQLNNYIKSIESITKPS